MANNLEETERRFEVIRITRKWLTSIELELMEEEPSERTIEGAARLAVRQLLNEFGTK